MATTTTTPKGEKNLRDRMNKTASEAIFHSLKTSPTQTVVTIEVFILLIRSLFGLEGMYRMKFILQEVIAVLQQVLAGLMKPQVHKKDF